MTDRSDLPFIDEHSREVGAVQSIAWEAVHRYASGLAAGDGSLPARVLGTEPAPGFEMAEAIEGELVALAGRHRFARYRLEFRVEPLGAGSLIRARTLAEFPGPHGRLYRALVIGSRGHVVAVKWMLGRIARTAERSPQASASGTPRPTARRRSGAAR